MSEAAASVWWCPPEEDSVQGPPAARCVTLLETSAQSTEFVATYNRHQSLDDGVPNHMSEDGPMVENKTSSTDSWTDFVAEIAEKSQQLHHRSNRGNVTLQETPEFAENTAVDVAYGQDPAMDDPSESSLEGNPNEEIDVGKLLGNEVSRAVNAMADEDDDSFNFLVFVARLQVQAARESPESPKAHRGSMSWDPHKRGSLMSMGQASVTETTDDGNGSASEANSRETYLRTLFLAGVDHSGDPHHQVARLQDRHKSLSRVLVNIFTEYSQDNDMAPRSTDATVTSQQAEAAHKNEFQKMAYRIVRHTYFVSLMMFLTIYALFAPDVVKKWGDKSVDEPFAIINSAVFLIYVIEMVLHAIAQTSEYVCTVIFILDLLALFSVFMDTWFMQADLLDEQSSQSARMARSARLTRLARITRIARLTKMFPVLLNYLLQQKVSMARRIIRRRLWRTCLFLDYDHDGMLNFFDLKFFYGSLLQTCSHLSEEDEIALLRKDVPFLLAEEAKHGPLAFEDVIRIFNNTKLGQDVLHMQLSDLESRAAAFQLIRTVSDRSALKLCVGVLLLLGALQLVTSENVDQSPKQGLAQLDMFAQLEHELVGATESAEYICDQIILYKTNEPLIVILDGWIHYEDGHCLSEPEAVSLSEISNILDSKVSASSLRAAEVMQLCWPDLSDCSSARSAALLDQEDSYKDDGLWSLLNTVIVILLLLIFIFILNQKISNFSKTLLQPLRSLLDDMMVLSDFELADMDEHDLPGDVVKVQQGVWDEFRRLQNSFKRMRSAIRSWSKFVPPSIVQNLFSAGLEAKLGVVKVVATIFFCDIDGFEVAVQGLPPQEVLSLLAKVTGTIADCIQRNEGTFLEFIGDEVLAVYNVPHQQKHHVYSAVNSALQIHASVENYEADERIIPISCRCGVHTGPILAGNIGSRNRMKYGLLGDGINLTARLKGLNSRYHTSTLVSDQVVLATQARPKHLVFRPVDLVAVKGKKEPTIIYEAMNPLSRPRAIANKHAQAFEMYRQRRFAEAQLTFDEVTRLAETAPSSNGKRDLASRMLSRRCAIYAQNPPPVDWDGVERLIKKSFEELEDDLADSNNTENVEQSSSERYDWAGMPSRSVCLRKSRHKRRFDSNKATVPGPLGDMMGAEASL